MKLKVLSLTLGILLYLSPTTASAGDSPSFLNEIMPIFTRSGCNQGACHGKGTGQNGFRLSLRGYAPEADYKSLIREFDGRRLNRDQPESSLLLQKAVGQVAHQGGKVFDISSREYQTILGWIRSGAQGPKASDPKIVKLSLTPPQSILSINQSVQLQGIAEFSDGSKKDVSWLTKFESNDAAIASSTLFGQVKALRAGETAIRASFLTEVAVAIITVPYSNNIPAERFQARNNYIDEHGFNKLRDLKLEPSALSSDETFIRRVYLDTIGILPTIAETETFLKDPSPTKRSKLIDELLNRPEWIDYWTLQLSDMMQNRKERDHDVRGTQGVRSFHMWLRKRVAENQHWDALTRDILLATGSTREHPEIGYYIVTLGEHRDAERSEVVASVAQAFLGTRIGCAQCHNHPLEKYTQDDYYHFAGFFSRVKLIRQESKIGDTILKVSHADENRNNSPVGVFQPRTGQFLKPQPLDRSQPAITPKDDPRLKLVDWITDPKNEAFSGSMVNRLWKHFLGVGLVEPVDDLRATNPPSNPELWKALNRDFVAHQFDLKHLMRVILNSRIYQLSSSSLPGNEAETRYYSHYYARRLPAEVFMDAISQATKVPDSFSGYPEGIRAVQVPDPSVDSYFLRLFGRSDRVTACACERMGDVTMPQLLHLQNGDRVLQKIRSNEGSLAELLKSEKDDPKCIDKLFLMTFSRKPTEKERVIILKQLQEGEAREEVFRDLFWALLNSKNFGFNH